MGWTEGTLLAKLIRRKAPSPSLDPSAPGMTPRTRRSLHTAVTAAVIVALVGSSVWFGAYIGVLPWRGPLEQGRDTGWARLNFHARVGSNAAYTLLSLANPSHVDVTIDSVTPTAPLPNLQVVEAWFPEPATPCSRAATGPESALAAPSDCRVPAHGYVLPADTSAAGVPRFVVVLKADAPGRYVSKGFDIHYHVGPISYTTTVRSGFVMNVGAA